MDSRTADSVVWLAPSKSSPHPTQPYWTCHVKIQ